MDSMIFEEGLIYLCCVLVIGLIGWLFRHTVDRKIHLTGQPIVTEEVFSAKLSALEDRLRGQIVAIKVKLEELEKFTSRIDSRLEKLIENNEL